ncbi:MAG: FAD-dependent oxidoreductase [Roseibacillus sp.]|nr:FAD-dependent oxidoreductase [Roseibacillus sp.]
MADSIKNADRHVVVVGAGPGGLTAAMILAHRGYRVTVVEKAGQVGGRSACLHAGPYAFDYRTDVPAPEIHSSGNVPRGRTESGR